MLTKERVQNTEESKERWRVNFPRIEELRMKALNAKVDNDKILKHVDEAIAEKTLVIL